MILIMDLVVLRANPDGPEFTPDSEHGFGSMTRCHGWNQLTLNDQFGTEPLGKSSKKRSEENAEASASSSPWQLAEYRVH